MNALAPWAQYICHACGYIYNEADGDADGGLAAGTRYADIPDDWACPLCGVTKADFEPYTPPSRQALRASAKTAGLQLRSNRHQPAGVVIVGAGRAGWQAAERLRAGSPALPITLVTSCSGDVYDKPMLSVAMARGLTADALVKERGVDAAVRLNVKLLADTHAVRICTELKQLRTTRGTLRYDRLVLAHGAHPAPPATLPPTMVWRVNHLNAYTRLRAALCDTPKDVVIVGAGLVGSELANDLALGGHRITLLDVQAEPLGRWNAEHAGTHVLEAWKDLPIRFVGGVAVAKVERLSGRFRVTTEDGQRFPADQVVAATGLQTPGRLAQGAGLAWRNGIDVSPDTLQTSNPFIHALGDCITIDGQASRFIEPISRQAQTLAAALCGGPTVPFEQRRTVVRVKTTSRPLTLAGA